MAKLVKLMKRVCSIIVAVCIVVTLLPVNVMAQELAIPDTALIQKNVISSEPTVPPEVTSPSEPTVTPEVTTPSEPTVTPEITDTPELTVTETPAVKQDPDMTTTPTPSTSPTSTITPATLGTSESVNQEEMITGFEPLSQTEYEIWNSLEQVEDILPTTLQQMEQDHLPMPGILEEWQLAQRIRSRFPLQRLLHIR